MAKNADCSSTPDPFHNVTIEKGGVGGVLCDVKWQWDGVSVRPGCNGPVQTMRVRNPSGISWYAHLPNARGGPRVVEIAPSTDVTLNRTQCVAIGIDQRLDIDGTDVTTTP